MKLVTKEEFCRKLDTIGIVHLNKEDLDGYYEFCKEVNKLYFEGYSIDSNTESLIANDVSNVELLNKMGEFYRIYKVKYTAYGVTADEFIDFISKSVFAICNCDEHMSDNLSKTVAHHLKAIDNK